MADRDEGEWAAQRLLDSASVTIDLGSIKFENKEMQKTRLAIMFGWITVNRRKYRDRDKGEDTLSPFLTDMAVQWAVRGPSYRDARDHFCDLLGYDAVSHETICQEV